MYSPIFDTYSKLCLSVNPVMLKSNHLCTGQNYHKFHKFWRLKIVKFPMPCDQFH